MLFFLTSERSEDIVCAAGADIVHAARRGFRPAAPRPDFVPCSARPDSATIVWENNPPAQKRHDFFQSMGIYKSPLAFPYVCPSFLPAGCGDNDIHTACGRYPALPDDIRACGVDDICEQRLANDEAPKPFRFRGFIYPLSRRSPQGRRRMAAIYSRGTCRPTRRPTAVRAASQTAPAVCPRLRG